MQLVLLKPLVALDGKKKAALVFLKPNKDLDDLFEWYTAGRLRPVIDGPYALDEVPQAMQRFAEGRHSGKVVIGLDDNA
jgi:NADPH:quinone reductase-like Zn-dependent oxidoreductase